MWYIWYAWYHPVAEKITDVDRPNFWTALKGRYMLFEKELAVLVTQVFPNKNQGCLFWVRVVFVGSPAVIVSLQTVFFLLAYTLQQGWRLTVGTQVTTPAIPEILVFPNLPIWGMEKTTHGLFRAFYRGGCLSYPCFLFFLKTIIRIPIQQAGFNGKYPWTPKPWKRMVLQPQNMGCIP